MQTRQGLTSTWASSSRNKAETMRMLLPPLKEPTSTRNRGRKRSNKEYRTSPGTLVWGYEWSSGFNMLQPPWTICSMGIIIPKKHQKTPKNIVLLHRSAQLQVGPCRCSVQIFAEPPVQRACNTATKASLRWSSNGREPPPPQPTSGKGTSSNQTCELQRHGSGCVSKMMRKKVNKNTLSLSVLLSSFSV